MRWWRRFTRTSVDVEPGRQSVPDDGLRGSVGVLSKFYDTVLPDFPLEYLKILEVLGIFNPDMGQALSIIVNLGNTGHELEVEAANPEAVIDELNTVAATVYRIGGGVDGVVNHLLRQLGLMGAMSAEWVIADRIEEGVTDVVTPPVRSIRFRREDGGFAPYQYTSRAFSPLVPLNPFTYSYSPVQTMDDSPYGIPTFYAALKNIEIQLSMVGNLDHIVKKMGLLGFLDVSLEVPQQKAGESDAAYRARLQGRLKDYAKAFGANFSRGVAVHYKDQELKHTNVGATAAAGAKTVFQINEEQICSALDIPPSMMGRSYSTTETYAEVDFDRLLTRLGNYRRPIKRFVEKGYLIHLLLKGVDAQVSLHFNENSGFKEGEKAEAEGKRINNALAKRDGGIIDDDQAARELGYEEATGHVPGDNLPPWDGGMRSLGSKRFRFDSKLGRYVHKPERIHLASEKDKRVQNYAEALRAMLAAPQSAAVAEAVKELDNDHADEKAFASAVWQAFSGTLVRALEGAGVDALTDRYVAASWQAYRYEDTSFLQAACCRPGPRRSRLAGLDLTLADNNAKRYLGAIDRHYFGAGNYLADNPSVQPQFIGWLQREYIDKGLNIKDDRTEEEFTQRFSAFVDETSWKKINQLVDTTMARIQNMGQTLKLYEAGFARYRIVGPRGGPICAWCASMVGRVFEVEAAAQRLAKIVGKGFEDVKDLPPFLSSNYTVEEVREMSDAELQRKGFDSPPYHPECRHRKAAED